MLGAARGFDSSYIVKLRQRTNVHIQLIVKYRALTVRTRVWNGEKNTADISAVYYIMEVCMDLKRIIAAAFAAVSLLGAFPLTKTVGENIVQADQLDYSTLAVGDIIYRRYSDHVELYSGTNAVDDIDIDKELLGLPVTIICEKAFEGSGISCIRLPESVDLQVNNTVPSPNNLRIAPLIFISLIENAFKHGIRTSEKSFIHLNMDYDKNTDKLHFRIENSNFPKNEEDRSGSGIGLEQVQKRLDLVYPNQYTWNKGVKENTYYSDITIQLDTKKIV